MGNMAANIVASPKTTFLGVVGIMAIVAKWVQAGHVDFNDFQSIWDIVISLGLIVAKDANITGAK